MSFLFDVVVKLTVLLLSLYSIHATSSDDCTATFITSSGDATERNCKFPVTVGGQEFSSCLTYSGYVPLDQRLQTIELGQSWCPTAGNFRLGSNKDHKWGVCNTNCGDAQEIRYGCRWLFDKKNPRFTCSLCQPSDVEYVLSNGTTITVPGNMTVEEMNQYGMSPNLPDFPDGTFPEEKLNMDRICLFRSKIKELKIKGRGNNRVEKITKHVGFIYKIPAPTAAPITSEPTPKPTPLPTVSPTHSPITSPPTTSAFFQCDYCTNFDDVAGVKRSCCLGTLNRGRYDVPEQKDFFEENCSWDSGTCFDDEIEGAGLYCGWCDTRWNTNSEIRDCCNGIGPKNDFPGSTGTAQSTGKAFFAQNCQFSSTENEQGAHCSFNTQGDSL